MNKALSFSILTIIFATTLFHRANGQAVYAKTYGTEHGDQGYALGKISDDEFVIAGSYETDGIGTALFFLSKVNLNGDTSWTKTYSPVVDTSSFVIGGDRHPVGGRKAFDLDICHDDGMIVIGAGMDLIHGSEDILVVRTDTDGDTLWTRAYGGTEEDYANGVTQTSDSGFVVVGTTESFGAETRNGIILRLDQNGDTLWTLISDVSAISGFQEVIECEDGSFLVVGSTFGSGEGNADILALKVDDSGNTIWEKTYGGEYNEFANDVIEVASGFVMVGSTESYGQNLEDAYMVSIDNSGNLINSKAYGTYAFDGFQEITEIDDGSYTAVGYTQDMATNTDILLVNFDEEGNMNWYNSYGGTEYDYGHSLETIPDGYLVLGFGNSIGAGSDDIYLTKVNNIGYSCNHTSVDLVEGEAGTVEDLATLDIIRNAFTGTPPILVGMTYAETIQDCDGFASIEEEDIIDIELFPNPATNRLTVKLPSKLNTKTEVRVLDVLGNEVYLESYKGEQFIDLNLSGIKSGSYLLVLKSSDLNETIPFVIQH